MKRLALPLLALALCAADKPGALPRVEFPKPPELASVPQGPLGDAVREGQQLATQSFELLPGYARNGLHCSSCHLEGGTRPGAGPWVGITAVFPEYRSRNNRVNRIEDRINDCFERSLNGRRLPMESRQLSSLVAYMTWLSRGVPVGSEVQGRGFPRLEAPAAVDRQRGAQVFKQKCVVCHGPDGEGQKSDAGTYLFPPLWGPRSFSIGAGMARLDTAAAFVRHNMPLGAGETLSVQDSYDVADWVIHQPRPDFAPKGLDWPDGGKPRDARY